MEVPFNPRANTVILRKRVPEIVLEAGYPLISSQIHQKLVSELNHGKRFRVTAESMRSNLAHLCDEKHPVIRLLPGLGYWPTGAPPFQVESVAYWPSCGPITDERLEAEVFLAFKQAGYTKLSLMDLVEAAAARGVLKSGKLKPTIRMQIFLRKSPYFHNQRATRMYWVYERFIPKPAPGALLPPETSHLHPVAAE